jgi:hypothetical protein
LNTESSNDIREGAEMHVTRAFMDDDLNVIARAGEKVIVVRVERAHKLPYVVEPASGSGKSFRVSRSHLMYNRPIR